MESNFNLVFGNKSDFGKVRERNEDYMEAFKCGFGDVFVVCDGMGGHVGGEIASRLAAATIKNYFLANPTGLTSTRDIIHEAIKESNKTVFQKSVEDPSLKGMGTTIVVLVVNEGIAYYGHVGDSRLYIIRGNNIYQLTRDHSFVQGLVDQGLLSFQEAENHPRKNEITRALGIGEVVVPDVTDRGLILYQGDKFILCTDGLSGMVNESEILSVAKQMTPFEACERLVNLANMAGGTDNITVQIISVHTGQEIPTEQIGVPPQGAIINDKNNIQYNTNTVQQPVKSFIPPKKQNNKSVYLYLIGGLLILVIAGVLLYFFVFNKDSNKQQTENESEKTEQIIDTVEKTPDMQQIKNRLGMILKNIYNDGFLSENENEKFDKNGTFTYDSKQEDAIDIPLGNFKEKVMQNRLEYLSFYSLINDVGNSIYNCEYTVEDKISKTKDIYKITFSNKNGNIKFISIVFSKPKEEKKDEKIQNTPPPNDNRRQKNDGKVVKPEDIINQDKIEKEVDKTKEKVEDKVEKEKEKRKKPGE